MSFGITKFVIGVGAYDNRPGLALTIAALTETLFSAAQPEQTRRVSSVTQRGRHALVGAELARNRGASAGVLARNVTAPAQMIHASEFRELEIPWQSRVPYHGKSVY
ncbi:unnamed protein product, partial [Iphiclides podalirius]